MNKYSEDYYKCISKSHSFPIPNEFEDGKWKLNHHPDRKNIYRLTYGFKIWMGSDHDEIRDMADGASKMHGNCLILGLGIGLVVQMINVLKKVKKITIVEKEPIVIKHIGPWLKENISIPIEIIESDDEEFLKNTTSKFDTMFADTWELCTDALKKIERLKTLAKGKIKGKKVYWAEKKMKNELKRKK